MADDSPAPDRAPHPDPEIEALLQFAAVRRHTRRHDGWPPERQRGFIAALATLGHVDRAAQEVGRTQSGAWKVRNSAGAEGFSQAWDAALDLFHARNPEVRPFGGRARLFRRAAPEPESAPAPEPDEEMRWQQLCDGVLNKYALKIDAERRARLDGSIVEADYYVRQLTWLEVVIDMGDMAPRAIELLNRMKHGDHQVGQITATPISLLLDELRRSIWAAHGEPERPPLAPLGFHDGEAATGQPPECQHWPERDGDSLSDRSRHEAHLHRNAEAQRLWEEKARADAKAWAEREGRG